MKCVPGAEVHRNKQVTKYPRVLKYIEERGKWVIKRWTRSANIVASPSVK